MEKVPESALPTLIPAIYDSTNQVRAVAVKAVVRIGKAALPALEKLMKGKDDQARWYAVRTVLKMGKVAAPVVGTLVEILNRPKGYVRNAAADALGAAGVSSVEVMAALRKASANVRAKLTICPNYGNFQLFLREFTFNNYLSNSDLKTCML